MKTKPKDKRVPGAKAIIRNTSAGGVLIVEGMATLKSKLPHDRWLVRFYGEGYDVERFVQEEDVQ
ncbi:MAG: hypothetical protein M0R32_08405 [Candidatus Cloacimonetes bacterium]|jgi:hypothetical protein|nr:hypothetical protein [Candidatus Cloacimonadota bacterium]